MLSENTKRAAEAVHVRLCSKSGSPRREKTLVNMIKLAQNGQFAKEGGKTCHERRRAGKVFLSPKKKAGSPKKKAASPKKIVAKSAVAKKQIGVKKLSISHPSTKKTSSSVAPAAQNSVSAPPAPKSSTSAILSWDDFQIGSQVFKGGNEKYEATRNGKKYYIKRATADNEERSIAIAANEILASKLYRLTGLLVPNLELVKRKEGSQTSMWIASEFQDNYRDCMTDKSICELIKTKPEKLKDLLPGFMVDCWLAAHDVIGMDYSNVGCETNTCETAMRIDVGGALLYRALGEPKYDRFSATDVPEFTVFRSDINPQARKVFKHVTEKDIQEGKNMLRKVNDAEVRKIVSLYEPFLSLDDRIRQQVKDLADALITRRQILLEK
jgi:hypothetical protein